MRHDAAYRYFHHQPAKDVQFRGTLVAAEKPIHGGILHKLQDSPPSAYSFDVRSTRISRSRGKKVYNAERASLFLEFGDCTIER